MISLKILKLTLKQRKEEKTNRRKGKLPRITIAQGRGRGL